MSMLALGTLTHTLLVLSPLLAYLPAPHLSPTLTLPLQTLCAVLDARPSLADKLVEDGAIPLLMAEFRCVGGGQCRAGGEGGEWQAEQ